MINPKNEFETYRDIRGQKQQELKNQGVLILVGSHITEMNLCLDFSSPLYMLGFRRYYFKPLSHFQMLRFLKQFNLTPHDMLFYTCISNGLIGILAELETIVNFT